ncbi:MAG TPA: hypothetical protein VFY18_04805, partial [Candidatus Limnocylindrales bacterium]|nr:hypothetical protein [Candidatus Limnocylindrales bacterium]
MADAARDPRTALGTVAHRRPSPVGGPGVSPSSPVQSARISTSGSSTVGGVFTPSSAASYHGRNHVWIPSLRISRSVSSFPCSRTRPPDNAVYRWGCAGR